MKTKNRADSIVVTEATTASSLPESDTPPADWTVAEYTDGCDPGDPGDPGNGPGDWPADPPADPPADNGGGIGGDNLYGPGDDPPAAE